VGAAAADEDQDQDPDTAALPGPVAQAVLTEASVVSPRVYWGAFVNGWPDDPKSLDSFEAEVGRKPSLVHWGQPWFNKGQPQVFQTAYMQTVRDRGSIPVVDWGSWDVCCDPVVQPNFQLAKIAGGAYDAYVTQWAQAAHAWGHPFFIRFDHEMNGWWNPWAEQSNGNHPGEFVAAWRHIHDIFVQQGATNATWVWCPNVVGARSTPMAQVYPGDDYVDWTCLDGYNWGTDLGNLWISFDEVFNGSLAYGTRDSYDQMVNLAPSKPIMLGELATSENGGSKAAWISDMLENQLPHQFPQIKGFVWFDTKSGDYGLSWSIGSSATSVKAFTAGIASPMYAGNAYGTLNVSPIPAPEFLVPPSP
jgi:hypothetical protein